MHAITIALIVTLAVVLVALAAAVLSAATDPDDTRLSTPVFMVVAGLAAVAALILGGVSGNAAIESAKCQRRANELGLGGYRWGIIAGCRLEVAGRFVPEGRVRVNVNPATGDVSITVEDEG